ncbi:methyltransferase domain-containing protein [Actinomadura sp. WMMB 499]|uniref:methyltransferase domain-containing protein n=1 Tax=Actinomadura sp. WMMB 499 TaxID=1219491 RepID=UPI001247CCA5|nr:methyltransferase domain-containing protein [Actinomadura sp. WMMB 499]QFG23613.1 methyltransferase domain-containing protein [Actinomadura sp. WMMB 499]
MTDWHEVMRSVPRRSFTPEVVWADLGPGPWARIDRGADPDEWERVVALDQPLVTQFEDGAAEGEGLATSSLSMPAMVVRFLEQLDPFDHHRVLEIGTGAGWTAGLLSERVGAGNVTTVEIDPGLSAQAGARLKAAGYEPEIVVGDGAEGRTDGAPFDRVHATCAVAEIPYAWVEQTRPGGVIVAPYSAGFGCGAILRLDVLGDGTAVGRFAGSADYMVLRSQRPARGPARAWPEAGDRDVRISRTRLDPRSLPLGPGVVDVAVAAQVPGVISRFYSEPDGATLWVLDRDDRRGSWASVDYEPGANDFEVQQAGDRDLWDEVEAAYLRWVRWGRPGMERFGITVTAAGDEVWFDGAVPAPVRRARARGRGTCR